MSDYTKQLESRVEELQQLLTSERGKTAEALEFVAMIRKFIHVRKYNGGLSILLFVPDTAPMIAMSSINADPAFKKFFESLYVEKMPNE